MHIYVLCMYVGVFKTKQNKINLENQIYEKNSHRNKGNGYFRTTALSSSGHTLKVCPHTHSKSINVSVLHSGAAVIVL